MKTKPIELHIEWDDGCTIEIRYFDSICDAKRYVKEYGIKNYTFFKNGC